MRLRVAMQEIMTAKVGIFRTGADLEQAVDELQTLLVAQPQHRACATAPPAPTRSW